MIDLVVIGVVAVIIQNADPGHLAANQAADGLDSAGEFVLFHLGTFIWLFGGELFSIIPFLAVLSLGYNQFRLSRTDGIVSTSSGIRVRRTGGVDAPRRHGAPGSHRPDWRRPHRRRMMAGRSSVEGAFVGRQSERDR